jgi:glycosyltransferase involved in cell wall biosynthesis/2-polyprenyl-3-methyl-5-hydroxy-6-metoxy-1,4-benzoquinol methylase
MKLAYFSPLNPLPSGISDYSEELLPYLAAHADIDLFVDGFEPVNQELRVNNCLDYRNDPRALNCLNKYDAIIYHIGNDHRYHAGIINAMRRHPGIAVFHEFILHDYFEGQAKELRDWSLYLEEIEACYGLAERERAEDAIRRGRTPPQVESPLDFPLNCRVAQSAGAIIAHSEWTRSRLEQIAPGIPTKRISMPVKLISPVLAEAWAQRKATRKFISIATFGLIIPRKCIQQTLAALAGLRDEFDFHFSLVGAENPYWDVRELILQHGMTEHVSITGHVSLEDFARHIATTDVAINMREYTVGETSASLCRIMAMGVPAVISDMGWFSELPDDSVVKVSPHNNFAELQSKLRMLLKDAEARSLMGERAKQYILREHSIWLAAERYIEFAREVIEQRPAGKVSISADPIEELPDVSDEQISAAPFVENGATPALPEEPAIVELDPTPPRLKLAYFSPLNPQPSGISDYSEELLMHLRNYIDIDLFVDGFEPANPEVCQNFGIYDYATEPLVLDKFSQYDAVLYHLGNDYRYHSGIYAAMQKHPGIVVLHDFALQDFFLGLARHEGRMSIYLDELQACHGRRERVRAEEFVNRGAVPPHEGAPLSFPLNAKIARTAEGVIVHSEWSRARLAPVAAGVPIACIKHHITDYAAQTPSAKKDRGEHGQVIIASFGLVTPDKAIERVLRALSTLRDEFDFSYVLVGSAVNFPELPQLVRHYGLQDRVQVTGHVSLDEFQQRMRDTDIAITLRERPVGATSGSLCRLMAAGIPTIVSNVGAFSELPDDAVVKVEHDRHGDELLQAFLRRLIQDQALRERIGNNARNYVLAEHTIENSAARYAVFIHEVIARRPRKNFFAGVADELRALDIRAGDDQILQGVAAELATLAPVPGFNAVAPARPRRHLPPSVKPRVKNNGNGSGPPPISEKRPEQKSAEKPAIEPGRMAKVPGIDYKSGAREYTRVLSEELKYYLRTKPFCNLHKPIKYSGDGMDPETARHFYDFANMAVVLGLRADAKILDVACGPGWLSEYFARLGYDVTGIDISDGLIEAARERLARLPYQVDQETPLSCRFLIHDVEAAPLTQKFDAIICYDSLHHFENEERVFRNLANMLDVGGFMFILEGNKPPTGSATEKELRGFMEKYKTLESPFSGEYLRSLIDEHGFAIVGDYVSVNGLFEREMLTGDGEYLPLHTLDLDYHYLTCMKVTDDAPGSIVADSREPGVLRAELLLRTPPPESVAPGQRLELNIAMVNFGDTVWLTGQETRAGLVMPGVKIADENGVIVAENHGPLLPRPVAPGQSLIVNVSVIAPDKPGSYAVKIDLVDQKVCWFEDRGSRPIMFDLIVSEA